MNLSYKQSLYVPYQILHDLLKTFHFPIIPKVILNYNNNIYILFLWCNSNVDCICGLDESVFEFIFCIVVEDDELSSGIITFISE